MKPIAAYEVILDIRNPETHRIKVTIRSKTKIIPEYLAFPVWTPGSYMIREYSRHITNFSGTEKINKNTWKVLPKVNAVGYEVYAFEPGVRASFLDHRFAIFNGASILPILGKTFQVKILTHKNWKFLASALPFKRKNFGWECLVEDDDVWIDSPILLANQGYSGSTNFTANNIPHRISWVGIEPNKSVTEITKDIKKIATTTIQMFGGAPFKHYDFLLILLPNAYGGLEHRCCNLSQFDNNIFNKKDKYQDFLSLMAHEYFHAWNVKSLRPKTLGPFDYFKENYCSDLWFVEGLTSYFDEWITWKAGLYTNKEYYQKRLEEIEKMEDGRPGHKRRSLAEASLDAWIRAYRPDEDSANSDISYYVKGAHLGLCWDAYLQKKSKGRWTLAKLMRAFWKKFGIDATIPLHKAPHGYSQTELLVYAEKITKIPQRTLLKSWVTQHKPLPWKIALNFFNITYQEKVRDPAVHYLGAKLKWDKNIATIAEVYSGSSAEKARLAPGDELLALEKYRLNNETTFPAQLEEQFHKTKYTQILFSRNGRILQTQLLLKKHQSLGISYRQS